MVFNAGCYGLMDRLHQQLDDVMARYHDSWDIHADFPPVNFQSHEDGKIFNEVVYRRASLEPPRFGPPTGG